MKKISLVSSILLLTFVSGVAYAETSTVSATTTKVREKVEKQIEAKKADLENRIAKKLDKEREKIANRFEEAIKNLKKLADRIEVLIAKFESKGKDMSDSKVLLVEAEAKIALAEADLASLGNVLASTTASTTRKELLRQTKVQSEKAKESIKVAHKALVRVINSLKPGQREDKVVATTTSTSTTSTSTNP